MSDLSTLSHEYAATASFAEEVNTAVLKIKKALLKAPGHEKLSKDQLEQERQKLAQVLGQILQRLSPFDESRISGEGDLVIVPEDVMDRIQSQNQATLTYYVEDVQAALGALRSGSTLGSREIQALDSLCDIAAATASSVFRRLWRR